MAAAATAASAPTPTDSAYIDARLSVAGAVAGPLHGMAFAVKDLFDIAGHPTGFGNPTWLATHAVPSASAPAVQRLLDAGASIRGKTHMDELAYSLNGENAHYGTPRNPAAPGRIPGGSSSGSASACASGDVDFALGSDTGGSVRIPASYCGLYGMRPTHGRGPLEGARPLAPSFDTPGIFARDARVLRSAMRALLGSPPAPPDPPSGPSPPLRLSRWLVASDAFDLAVPGTADAIYGELAPRLKAGGRVGAALGAPTEVSLGGGDLGSLTEWFDAFRVCQAWEVWRAHGEWVESARPEFGPGIRERFAMAKGVTQEARDAAAATRAAVASHVTALLGSDGFLALPTAPGPAPLCATPPAELDAWRSAMISLTCVAGLTGLPQITLPVATVGGLPVGLSVIGPPGSDEALLDLAVVLAECCAPPK
jgi:amidase